MKRFSRTVLSVSVLSLPTIAFAQTVQEHAGRIIRDTNIARKASQLRELSNQTLDQLISARKQLDAEIRKRQSLQHVSTKTPSALPVDVPSASAPGGNIEAEFDPSDLEEKYKDKLQNLYVRSDPLDAFHYLYPMAPLDGKGASVTYTADRLNDTQNLALRGFGSYVLFRESLDPGDRDPNGPVSLSGYAVAPFVFANGALQEPLRSSERSALQVGLDAQLEFWRGGIFSLQNIAFRPYVQTDFRGEGEIAGITALYEPYNLDWNLGGRYDVAEPKYIGWLWRVVPELNVFHVKDAGYSNFASDTTYAWLGGTLQARAILFENMSTVPTFLCGRIFVNGSFEYFWNLETAKPIHDIEAEVGYILTPQATPSNRACVASEGEFDPTKSRSKTSLSLVYNKGTDRTVYQKRDMLRLQLSFQY